MSHTTGLDVVEACRHSKQILTILSIFRSEIAWVVLEFTSTYRLYNNNNKNFAAQSIALGGVGRVVRDTVNSRMAYAKEE